ncbi:MAG: DUF1640 domain-containing protein [Pseudomonadota bacterium]|nr:DUF1640 domain-containing protein [Pseudomonadota bacterium]
MATVTFDTLELTEALKKSGLSEPQSEAIVRAIAKAQDRLVTEDILENRLAPLKADLLVLKWMMAVVIAVNVIPALTKLLVL